MSDFDRIIDRRPFHSLKWNVAEGELPLWVADMDFEAPPCVRAALRKRLDHGIFGYTEVPDEWYDAYRNWWAERHGLTLERAALLASGGRLICRKDAREGMTYALAEYEEDVCFG